jgi:hypothetical protein
MVADKEGKRLRSVKNKEMLTGNLKFKNAREVTPPTMHLLTYHSLPPFHSMIVLSVPMMVSHNRWVLKFDWKLVKNTRCFLQHLSLGKNLPLPLLHFAGNHSSLILSHHYHCVYEPICCNGKHKQVQVYTCTIIDH